MELEIAGSVEEDGSDVADEGAGSGCRECGRLLKRKGAARRNERLVALTLEEEDGRERVRQEDDLVEP